MQIVLIAVVTIATWVCTSEPFIFVASTNVKAQTGITEVLLVTVRAAQARPSFPNHSSFSASTSGGDIAGETAGRRKRWSHRLQEMTETCRFNVVKLIPHNNRLRLIFYSSAF